MTMVNAYTPGQGTLSPEDDAHIARLLAPACLLLHETPVHFVRVDRVWPYAAAAPTALADPPTQELDLP